MSVIFKLRCFQWHFILLPICSTWIIVTGISIGLIIRLDQHMRFNKIEHEQKNSKAIYLLSFLYACNFIYSSRKFDTCKLLYILKIPTLYLLYHKSVLLLNHLLDFAYYASNIIIYIWPTSPLIRGYTVLLNYFIMHGIIMLTTPSHHILIESSTYLKYYPLRQCGRAKILFMIFLAYEFICNLEIKCKDIIVSIKLQSLENRNNAIELYCQLFILLFHRFMDCIQGEILHCTNVIYLRELVTGSSNILSNY